MDQSPEQHTDGETSLPKVNINNCSNLCASGNSKIETEGKLKVSLGLKRSDMSNGIEGQKRVF